MPLLAASKILNNTVAYKHISWHTVHANMFLDKILNYASRPISDSQTRHGRSFFQHSDLRIWRAAECWFAQYSAAHRYLRCDLNWSWSMKRRLHLTLTVS